MAWWEISKGIVLTRFFTEEGIRWMEVNLNDDFQMDGVGWGTWFGLTVLNIWQRRNENVFQGLVINGNELVHRIRNHAMWVK